MYNSRRDFDVHNMYCCGGLWSQRPFRLAASIGFFKESLCIVFMCFTACKFPFVELFFTQVSIRIFWKTWKQISLCVCVYPRVIDQVHSDLVALGESDFASYSKVTARSLWVSFVGFLCLWTSQWPWPQQIMWWVWPHQLVWWALWHSHEWEMNRKLNRTGVTAMPHFACRAVGRHAGHPCTLPIEKHWDFINVDLQNNPSNWTIFWKLFSSLFSQHNCVIFVRD